MRVQYPLLMARGGRPFLGGWVLGSGTKDARMPRLGLFLTTGGGGGGVIGRPTHPEFPADPPTHPPTNGLPPRGGGQPSRPTHPGKKP